MSSKKSRFKRIYLIVIAIITVVCVLAGICINVLHFNIFANGFTLASWEMVSEKVSVDEFDELYLDLKAGKFDIGYGDGFYVEYVYPDNRVPEITSDNGRLTIKDVGGVSLFQLASEPRISITLPKGKKLSKLDADVATSKITLTDTDIDDVKLVAGTGSINMNGCTAATLELVADVGSIELADTTFDEGTLAADVGSIDIMGCDFNALDIEADMGSVDIEGRFEALKAKCDLSSIDITSVYDKEDVDLDLECEMGQITFNGEELGQAYRCNHADRLR